MTFKNETPDSLEVTIPIRVHASLNIFLKPGEELTATRINEAVDVSAAEALNNPLINDHDNWNVFYEIVGVERDETAGLYNEHLQGETPMPDGVEYAE